jgi:GNAT superfamily N-acetyltransferase
VRLSSITIRPVEHRDAVEVAMLSGELGYPMAAGLIEERLEVVRASPPHQPADILVAVDLRGDRVIGWVHVCVPLFLTGIRAGSIWGLVVASTYRGRGVGRGLMEAAEQWAVDHDCKEMRLTSAVQRLEAHAFYERLGYRVEKSQFVLARSLMTPEK